MRRGLAASVLLVLLASSPVGAEWVQLPGVQASERVGTLFNYRLVRISDQGTTFMSLVDCAVKRMVLVDRDDRSMLMHHSWSMTLPDSPGEELRRYACNRPFKQNGHWIALLDDSRSNSVGSLWSQVGEWGPFRLAWFDASSQTSGESEVLAVYCLRGYQKVLSVVTREGNRPVDRPWEVPKGRGYKDMGESACNKSQQ